jgi:hypothetical protein
MKIHKYQGMNRERKSQVENINCHIIQFKKTIVMIGLSIVKYHRFWHRRIFPLLLTVVQTATINGSLYPKKFFNHKNPHKTPDHLMAIVLY